MQISAGPGYIAWMGLRRSYKIIEMYTANRPAEAFVIANHQRHVFFVV
jgi:hypothetical protein